MFDKDMFEIRLNVVNSIYCLCIQYISRFYCYLVSVYLETRAYHLIYRYSIYLLFRFKITVFTDKCVFFQIASNDGDEGNVERRCAAWLKALAYTRVKSRSGAKAKKNGWKLKIQPRYVSF